MGMYDRKVSLATEELAETLANERAMGYTWAEMELRHDLSRKTIRRIISKFNKADKPNPRKMWDHPCLKCKRNVPREYGMFLCPRCREENANNSGGLAI